MSNNTYEIFITCLSAYNQGHLHGEWIDATLSADELIAEKNRILAESPVPDAEEFFISDYELEGISIGEYENLETIAKLGEALESDDNAHIALKFLIDDRCYNIDDAVDRMDDVSIYQQFNISSGTDSALEIYAYELFFEVYGYDIPVQLHNYVDTDRFARDLEISGDVHVIDRYTLITNPNEF